MTRHMIWVAAAGAIVVLLGACAARNDAGAPASAAPIASATSPATAAEPPLPAESNPPGDIPDTQVFVTYRSRAGGFQIDVPEGWGRRERGPNVSFIDKFDGLAVSVSSESARVVLAALEAGADAGRNFRSHPASFLGDTAVLITFTSNSARNSVTGKRVRLENEAAVFARPEKTAAVLLWAPSGADNVDQWKHIESSFRWH